MIYEIYSDESFTHIKDIKTRFCFFFGGIFGSHQDTSLLHNQLQAIKDEYPLNKEVKWNNLDFHNANFYKKLLEQFFNTLEDNNSSIKYRQFCVDRKFVPQDKKELYLKDISSVYNIDTQFKLYYQFFKHSFGIAGFPENCSEIRFYIDGHTSKKVSDLKKFISKLTEVLGRPDITSSIKSQDSKKKNLIQIVDLIIGASSFRSGNKKFSQARIRLSKNREKAKLKESIYQYIYDNLRSIYLEQIEGRAFDLFSNKSLFSFNTQEEHKEWVDSHIENRPIDGRSHYRRVAFRPKIYISIFKPKKFIFDKGWDNDKLSKEGYHQKIELEES